MLVVKNEGRIDFAMQGREDPERGQYLFRHHLEAADNRNAIVWTTNRDRAMRFADTAEVLRLWSQTSRYRPVRGDGQPNRPFTLWTITTEEV